jgi:hypothetical protein
MCIDKFFKTLQVITTAYPELSESQIVTVRANGGEVYFEQDTVKLSAFVTRECKFTAKGLMEAAAKMPSSSAAVSIDGVTWTSDDKEVSFDVENVELFARPNDAYDGLVYYIRIVLY